MTSELLVVTLHGLGGTFNTSDFSHLFHHFKCCLLYRKWLNGSGFVTDLSNVGQPVDGKHSESKTSASYLDSEVLVTRDSRQRMSQAECPASDVLLGTAGRDLASSLKIYRFAC